MEDVGKSEPNSETAIAAVDPIKPKPDEDSQNEIQGESSSLPASNESNARKVPESLPFLNDQLVADFIAEQEQIAGDANDASNWSKEEEMNFFRGLYVHGKSIVHAAAVRLCYSNSLRDEIIRLCDISAGWGEWTNISKMVQTRDKPGCKSHALSLEKKFPELRKYFSANQVNKMQQKQGVKIKRYGVGSSGRARRSSSSRVNSKSKTSTALRQKAKHSGPSGQPGPQLLRSDSKKVDSHSEGKKKSRSSHGNERATKPRGVISLGNFLISTDSCRPSSLIVDADESRSDDARAPDYANHSVRPPMPSNDSQIYIPGSRIYARWMNRDDPVSCKFGSTDTCRNLFSLYIFQTGLGIPEVYTRRKWRRYRKKITRLEFRICYITSSSTMGPSQSTSMFKIFFFSINTKSGSKTLMNIIRCLSKQGHANNFPRKLECMQNGSIQLILIYTVLGCLAKFPSLSQEMTRANLMYPTTFRSTTETAIHQFHPEISSKRAFIMNCFRKRQGKGSKERKYLAGAASTSFQKRRRLHRLSDRSTNELNIELDFRF